MAVDVEPPLARRQASEPKADPGRRVAAPSRRRRRLSGLVLPILAVNLSAVFILGVGLFYLDDYEKGLVVADIEGMRAQGQIVAAALGEIAVDKDSGDQQRFDAQSTRRLIRRLVDPTRARARLFSVDGDLIADSRMLSGPGGVVQMRELAPPRSGSIFHQTVFAVYDWLIGLLPRRQRLPRYFEAATQRADDYQEVRRALAGESKGIVRADDGGGLIISVAVPVQRYRRVLGALMLSHSGAEVERAARSVRFDILKVFGVVLAITVLASLYLAGTIARPVRRLAVAADRVRRGHGRLKPLIPDFSKRGDEIGDLSAALRDMTQALESRMDAIERFAADVAHELKNPLSSMQSAVETVARIDDPEQKRRMLAILQDDIQRLDRLISDISDASRLDTELSRAESVPVDIGHMLAALVEVEQATSAADAPRLRLDIENHQRLEVMGVEGRLVQVFRNLINNAITFSPPGGTITLKAGRDGRYVTVAVEDEGPGVPEDKRETIFDRFYSERPAEEKFGTHSGLGLSISKQIVDAHDGDISAENRCDETGRVIGARLVVRLPAD
ncbi:MAG: stimulus-sensing domain-containing protein [Kiloniellales bacterium]